MHQAAHVASDQDRRSARFNVLELGVHHGNRNLWHLNREQATKPAAVLGVWEFDSMDTVGVIEERLGLSAQIQVTKPVTRGVIRHRAVSAAGPYGLQPKVVDEELRQLSGSPCHPFGLGGPAGVTGHEFRDVMHDHVGA